MSERVANTEAVKSGDRPTVTAGVEVLAGTGGRKGLGRLWPFLGPAFVASVAYVDPGNYATNIEGGARLGYTLLWVILASNVMAMFVQALSAKLGIATRKNLAELCREHCPRRLVWTMWALMEVVAMATDLAEFLGPHWACTCLRHAAVGRGGRDGGRDLRHPRPGPIRFPPLEAVITVLVGVIAVCYLAELGMAGPDWGQAASSLAPPRFGGGEGLTLAVGILGATVMPHVIYLHSALTQGRIVTRDSGQLKRLFHYEVLDVVLAMGVAGAINAAMLIMAAARLQGHMDPSQDTIEQAHRTLEPLLGKAASTLFALSLLASGLSSSAVGTMSGQVIMQGFLRRKVPVWVRRLATMAPAMVVIAAGLDPTRTLVLSQVVLSFGLPLAVIRWCSSRPGGG